MLERTLSTMSRSVIVLTCVIAITSTIPSLTHAAESNTSDIKSMSPESMDHSKMDCMKNMQGMSMTGDTDTDFAKNMRMHHQMGIEMAETELKKGKNPQMLQMARDIIAAQKKEVVAFDRWLASSKKDMATTKPMAK